MAKNEHRSNNRINQIFDDLEKYLDFCKRFGYKFDEATLYDNRSFAFRQFGKYMVGKDAKDMWAFDAGRNT